MEVFTASPKLSVLFPIVTLPDTGLTSFPEAVAVAVTTSPAGRLSPVKLQTPFELEAVVPTDTLFEKTSMTVPLPSVVVPETAFIVVLVQYVPEITGVADTEVTVWDAEGLERQFIPAMMQLLFQFGRHLHTE